MARSVYWKDVVFPGDIADLTSVGPEGVVVPGGTTLQRPVAPLNGTIRYNTTTGFTEVFQGAAWSTITTAGIGGEPNTASNLGAGQGVFDAKVGFDLQFKSIVAGANIAIGSNATEIIISATGTGEINTASNLPGGTGTVFDTKAGVDLQFRSLLSLNPNLTIVDNGNTIDFDYIGAVGEINDGQNLGSGAEVFDTKLGLDLRFRSIAGTANQITATQFATEISVSITDNPIIPGNASMTIPIGPTAAQPVPVDGMLRYDSTTSRLRAVIAGVWQDVETTAGTFLPLGGGTMTGTINMTAGGDLILGVGSEIQTQGNIVMQAGTDIDMTSGGSILMQIGETVDGRDVSADGNVLDNINAIGTFGVLVRTADPNVFALRTLTGTANQIDIVDGDGVAGDPTISIPDNPIIGGTESITIPTGTTAQQPGAPTDGMLRINSTDGTLEFYINAAWVTAIGSLGGNITGGDLDLGGNDITNVGLTDGRDLSVDGLVIDDLLAIADDTGVVVKTGGGILQTQLVQPSATAGLLGGSVVNGDGSAPIEIGVDITGQAAIAAPLVGTEEFLLYDTTGTTNAKATIDDIITYIGASGLDAEIDVTGEFGFLTRTADGVVGDFERRTLTANTALDRRGIEILNGDGIAGDPVFGLDFSVYFTSLTLADTDELIGRNPGTGDLFKYDVATLRRQLLAGTFRASGGATALLAGVQQIPFTIGANDFNPDGFFADVSDDYTPVAGTYRIHVYGEADATTVAGRYIFRIRRNGIAEGSIGVLNADGTNPDSVVVSDLFVASGTDVFTVEVDNTTVGASALAEVRFMAERVY